MIKTKPWKKKIRRNYTKIKRKLKFYCRIKKCRLWKYWRKAKGCNEKYWNLGIFK